MEARWLEVTARARSRPDCTCGRVDARLPKNKGTWPPMTSFNARPPPLYGTCTMLTLAADSNSAPARCWAEPLPDEANDTESLLDLAVAISSAMFFAGNLALTRTTFGNSAITPIGRNAFTLS